MINKIGSSNALSFKALYFANKKTKEKAMKSPMMKDFLEDENIKECIEKENVVITDVKDVKKKYHYHPVYECVASECKTIVETYKNSIEFQGCSDITIKNNLFGKKISASGYYTPVYSYIKDNDLSMTFHYADYHMLYTAKNCIPDENYNFNTNILELIRNLRKSCEK